MSYLYDFKSKTPWHRLFQRSQFVRDLKTALWRLKFRVWLNFARKHLLWITAVRLKIEENQLVSIFCEIGVLVDGLKDA